ncbi:MAG: lipoprotein A-like protein [Chloroflexaceae bacterium]|nr:lipoprotein A-like protein [Chloroflexaceae bacterium]NJO06700.1 lipoprotein A-like protein [Chloroflexaceae bacterium]
MSTRRISYSLLLLIGILAFIHPAVSYVNHHFFSQSTLAQGNAVQQIFLPLVRGGTTRPVPQPTQTPTPSPEPSPTPEPSPVFAGEGTFYDATGAGNCSFDPSPNDLMVAALNTIDYDNARLCGAYIEVTGPLASVVVRVVDRCPECAAGDVDLSREAFARIANPIDGRVPITWRIVSPDLTAPVRYHFKDGSNPDWTAVQIRNHRNPVATLEYQTSNGEFRAMPREQYNYFVESSGLGNGPYTFRITDIYGNTLLDTNIPFAENSEASGSGQFPAP